MSYEEKGEREKERKKKKLPIISLIFICLKAGHPLHS